MALKRLIWGITGDNVIPSLSLGLRATGLYFCIVAAAAFILFEIAQTPMTLLGVLWFLLLLQVVLVGFCLLVVRRGLIWAKIGFGPIRWRAFIWLLPSILLMGMMIHDIAPYLNWQVVRDIGVMSMILLVVVPILIGFSEEVMFRGILLRGAIEQLSTVSAMMLSAVFFALLHAISGLVTQAFWPSLHQLALAFCVGLFLAPVALRIGNLWPLIVWHAAWDMIILLGRLVAVEHPLALAGILIQLIWCVPIWTGTVRAGQR